uniref:Chromate transporter n=1 Tax=Entomoneis paludosa TaxID=265537 RepID=A0A7S2V9V2_9STRA|mmetsp:Transcript_12970/g.26915  ORF Transcript_12970/g.26915 Transcript_12970/m.26915 type:complete len:462 (+) Transcript_12970:150-1535(+)
MSLIMVPTTTESNALTMVDAPTGWVDEELAESQSLPQQPEPKEEASFGTRLGQVALAAFPLGWTAFGDTTEQIAAIEQMVVVQPPQHDAWMDADEFQELSSLAQALPGPWATQLFLACAMCHAGPWGGLVALILWMGPGVTLLTVAGLWMPSLLDADPGWTFWLAGVAPAAVALVWHSSLNVCRTLDKLGWVLALASCGATVFMDHEMQHVIAMPDTKCTFPMLMIAGGLLAVLDALVGPRLGTYKEVTTDLEKTSRHMSFPLWTSFLILELWLVLLLVAVLLAQVIFPNNDYAAIFSQFFRMGSVVFGGEESLLPMMTTELIPSWFSQQDFSMGLALTQAAPGSIFNLAAYMGAVQKGNLFLSWTAVASIYAPSFLFLLAALPLWSKLRQVVAFQAFVKGVNAVSIGFMGAMCVFLWESNIARVTDVILLVVCLGLIYFLQVSAPTVVAMAILLGPLLND